MSNFTACNTCKCRSALEYVRYRDTAVAQIKSEDSQLRKDIIEATLNKQMPTAPNNTILPESY